MSKAPLIDIRRCYKDELVSWAVVKFGWKKYKCQKMSKRQLVYFWHNQEKFAKNGRFI
tara:strand:+ start:150 stop:323 length:174 start_codon:yes stop_codon:yes gene_type:complete